MNNKFKRLFLIGIFFLFIFPISISAESIKQTTIWNRSISNGGLGLGDVTYSTKGYGKRQTRYLGGWKLTTGNEKRVFCVEPGTAFPTNSTVPGYSETSSVPNGKWNISDDVENLEKVLSCWSNNNESITATQAIVWELISEERANINANQILGGDYTPYQSDGSVYGNGSGVTSLYERIKSQSSIYSEYQAVLRCAARFNIKPSFSYDSDSTAKSSSKLLSNYDDESQTFSYTFKHSSNVDSKLLKFYEVTSNDSGVKVTKTDNSITISTNKEYVNKTDVKIILKYAYKDNGSYKLNNDGPLKFYVKNSYQSLAYGSTIKETYLYVYTGKKPTYQLRVQKKDEDGKPMEGVKFNVYSDAGLKTKIGTTTSSDKNGWATLTGIKKIGKYYVQEAETPDGYKTNKEIVNVTVKGEHRTGSNKWPSASSVFTNKFMHLNLSKRTIDETGKEIDISDYTGKSCTGNYVGPVFTIKKDNKYVCVTPIAGKPGKYKLASSCDAAGATNEIKTCDGKFDIEAIKSGCYDITETTAPDGYTLPQNPTQKVCVTKGQSTTATVMYNGVSGVVFNKVTENGNPIDGGKFALQQKVNGVYRDMLLKHDTGAIYVYEANLKESDEKASYVLETSNGTINVRNLPPGEYRFVEKEAPEGYDAISDKDSKATFTISDKGIFGSDGKPATDYYQVKMVNQQTRVEGSYDSAELIVTIITGRKVINYALVIVGLAALLIALIILRKRFKK